MKILHILEGVSAADASHHNETWSVDELHEVFEILTRGHNMDMSHIMHEADVLSHANGRRTQSSYVAAFVRAYCAINGKVPTGNITNKNWFTAEGAKKTVSYARELGFSDAGAKYEAAVAEFNEAHAVRKERVASAKAAGIRDKLKAQAIKDWDRQFHISSVSIPSNIRPFINDHKQEMVADIVGGKKPRQVFVNWVAKRGGIIESFTEFLAKS